jgi:hypothetical protein
MTYNSYRPRKKNSHKNSKSYSQEQQPPLLSRSLEHGPGAQPTHLPTSSSLCSFRLPPP